MSSKKKLGYNWKARQRKHQRDVDTRERVVPKVEGLSETDAYLTCEGVGDSNVLVLSAKRKKVDTDNVEPAPKRRKLSVKQRKRLQKIVEAKEKKAQVCFQIMRTTRVYRPF